jgi:hypothetical protein
MIGFGRLMVEDEEDLGALEDRTFHFSRNCHYKALPVSSEQYLRIAQFEAGSGVPVHYLLYHPLALPWAQIIPVHSEDEAHYETRHVGAQVLRSRDLRPSYDGS